MMWKIRVMMWGLHHGITKPLLKCDPAFIKTSLFLYVQEQERIHYSVRLVTYHLEGILWWSNVLLCVYFQGNTVTATLFSCTFWRICMVVSSKPSARVRGFHSPPEVPGALLGSFSSLCYYHAQYCSVLWAHLLIGDLLVSPCVELWIELSINIFVEVSVWTYVFISLG